MIGLAVWIVILATAPLRRPDWEIMPETFKGTIFLLALVTSASLMPVEELPLASWQTALGLGFLSSVFDNIPLTALALKQGGYDWGFLAYAVGFGGSMIWFGSSAGVALSNMYPEAKSVGRWLRHGWHVALAYVVGFFVMLAILGWNPDPPHKKRVELPATHAHTTMGNAHMTTLQWLTLAVFAVTIIAIVINKLDATVAALLGVVVMVWMGTMTEVEAAQLVDWNVMAILVGIWIIAGYFGRTGVPSWLSVQSLKLSGGRPGLLILVLSMLTGLLSMFIDNVVCILMMAPVALPLARALGIPATPLVLMIGFSANFMGTALLLGDLPPQMLHSVAGAEFFDFIWQHGRPSSFPILMADLRHHAGVHVRLRLPPHRQADGGRRRQRQVRHPGSAVRHHHGRHVPAHRARDGDARGARRQARLHRAHRRHHPGARSSRSSATRLKEAPSFEHIVQELDWRAVFFYIALFALVGGLEKTHILADDGGRDEAAVRAELRARRHAALLGHDPDRRPRRARRLHPDLPLHDQGSRQRRHPALAAVVGGAVGRNARQQSHGRGRARALRGAAHRREGGGPQGLAARVPVLEPAVLPGQLASSATCSRC